VVDSPHPKAALKALWPAFLLGAWAVGIGVPPLLSAQDKPVIQPPPALGPGEKLALSVTAPKGAGWSILSFAPDEPAAAIQESHEGKLSVVWTGGRIDGLDKIEPFSAWKDKSVPVCKVWKGGKAHITIGTAFSEPFDSISDPILGPTRKSVAYVAREKPSKVWVVFNNGKMDVLNVQEHTLAISPADELFYVATVNAANGGTIVASFLNQSSKELKGYLGGTFAGPVAFGPDGTIAYTLLGGGTVQTTAGFTGPSFDRSVALRFSGDGKVIAYFIEIPAGGGKTKKLLAVGSTVGPKYDDVLGYPALSLDGKTIAYIAKKGSKWVVAQDAKFSDSYDLIRPRIGDVDQPVVSGDGRSVAFVAEKSGRSILVVNNRVMAEESYLSAPLLNFNGSTVTYGFVSGQNLISKTVAIPGR
jgi:hypothetical protein